MVDSEGDDMSKVLFIGVGAMGEPMAGHIAAAGYRLSVADADSAQAGAVAGRIGATRGLLPGAASEQDAVLLALPNSQIVEAVLESGGVLAQLAPGSLVIDVGSSEPASTRRLAELAAKRAVGYVDAPVSGGVVRARAGTLAAMLGGADADVARAKPLVSCFAGPLIHTGGSGTGHAMKALNNMLSAIGNLAASEVIAAGVRFGLDPRVMLEVLNASSGRNHATETKFAEFVLSGSYGSGFAMDLMLKDLGIALRLSQELRVETGLMQAAVGEWQRARADLEAQHGDDSARNGFDHTEIARWAAEAADIKFA